MTKYRVVQLGSLPIYRVEAYRTHWFRGSRWEPVMERSVYGGWLPPREFSTYVAATGYLSDLWRCDREADARRRRDWHA